MRAHAPLDLNEQWETNMRMLVLRAVLALMVAASGVALAASPASDPVIGTWKLDAAKSTFTAGQAFKSQTRTYSQSESGITLVTKTVLDDGKEMTSRMTYQMDGKDYPVTGNPEYDSISAQQVDSHTARFTLKQGGKPVGVSSRTVSKDGKTLHTTMKRTTATGEKVETALVLNKQ